VTFLTCNLVAVLGLRLVLLAAALVFTFIPQKAGSNNRKAQRQTHEKSNTKTWKHGAKCYKLARYLQRNVRAS